MFRAAHFPSTLTDYVFFTFLNKTKGSYNTSFWPAFILKNSVVPNYYCEHHLEYTGMDMHSVTMAMGL